MKLSLGMIYKDEVNQFQRIMEAYHWIFDEVVIAVDFKYDEFKFVAEHYGDKVKVLKYKWCDDFSDKRNFVHKNITGDMYMRLDADDAIGMNCVKDIRKIAEDAFNKDTSIVFGYYNYSRDEWGNINAAHWREVLIKNTDNLYWNKKIHENLLPKDKTHYSIEMVDGLIIDHLADEKHIEQSLLRNVKYLLAEYAQDKEKTDSRTLAYLGRMLHGIGQFDKAIFFLEKHINTSGWDEDRYCSWCMLADAYRLSKRPEQAIAAAFEALQERPDYPDAYLKMHDIYFEMEKWEKAETWGRLGLMKPVPKNFMISDPSAYGWRPVLSMAFTLFQMNKFEEALKLFNLAKRDVPTLDFIKQNEEMFNKAVEHKKFMESYLSIINYLKDRGEEEKIPELLKAAPKEFNENEIVIKLKHHYNKPKDWGKKSVVIFAANELPDWSPKAVADGIGGSEEAVIYLSKELVKCGWDVTVFNNCGLQAGVYDGVKYVNYIEFNPNDHYNIIISWRANIFESGVRGSKRIIWMHDSPNIKFEADSYKKFDKIVMLSKYHASMLPEDMPEDKVFISTNGINVDDFIGLESVEREKNRIIYASSYNRGLKELLQAFPEVRSSVPDATLHIYYGWETYDDYVNKGWMKDDGFKSEMTSLMAQPGVFHHGRIGHKELLKEYAKSEIMAYPCSYSGEINCIALTKGIASGCMVVSNDRYVMAERNPYIVCKDNEFKDRLISALKGAKPHLIDYKFYRQENGWDVVARDWSKNLFKFDTEVEWSDRLNWIRKHCSEDPKIVDIGCNKGHLFDGWDRSKITSVDIDTYDLPNFIQADASKTLPFNDKEFDIAVMGEIVEHTDDPVSTIREAMRVCKKLVITVPYEHKWTSELFPFETHEKKLKREGVGAKELALRGNGTAVKLYDSDNFDHLYHKHFFTPEIIKEVLSKAGIFSYKITEVRFDNWVWLGIVCGE